MHRHSPRSNIPEHVSQFFPALEGNFLNKIAEKRAAPDVPAEGWPHRWLHPQQEQLVLPSFLQLPYCRKRLTKALIADSVSDMQFTTVHSEQVD